MHKQLSSIAIGILLLAGPSPLRADPPPPGQETIRAAAMRGLSLLEKGASGYIEHRKCFSCHHQAMAILAMQTAQARGIKIDGKELSRQLQFSADFLTKNRDNYEKGKGQGGQVDTAGYALYALSTAGWKADPTTRAVAEYLLQRDADRDHWRPVSQRPPTEASLFTSTYLALNGLARFGVPEQEKRIAERFARARAWLRKTPAKDTEDRVFRLRALQTVQADAKDLQAARDELLKTQRKDGGWSQIDKLESDAYATGSALTALHQAGGLPTSDAAYQRGIAFLLNAQKDDGSWMIRSRSKPFQLYFESGFPHGKDQFISMAGSGWATIALVLACEPTVKGSK